MKMNHIPVLIVGLALCAMTCPIEGMAEESLTGGYSATSVTNAEVVAAAAFAIKAAEEKDGQLTKLTLVEILSVRQQVVAGMNFRLKLKVTLNGEEKEAEAVVWWQAWRKPNPYKLTSWEWK